MITLIGHGYIGQNLHQVLPQHHWITHRDPIPPHTTLVVNAAGYTGSPNVDQCEVHKLDCFQGNVLFPLKLRAYPTIHISTGCIFQGNKFYTELDTPNFDKSWYSYTKLLSQQQTDHTKDWTLRIRLPFGPQPHSRNLVTKLQQYPKLIDSFNSMTSISLLQEVVNYIIFKRPEPGIFHVCNPEPITLKEFAQLFNIHKPWMTPEEFKQLTLAPRSECTLSSIKLTSLPTTREAIKEHL